MRVPVFQPSSHPAATREQKLFRAQARVRHPRRTASDHPRNAPNQALQRTARNAVPVSYTASSPSLSLSTLGLMRALWLLTAFISAGAFAGLPEHESRSPDGCWLVLSSCGDTRQLDSCSIVLSRRADGKVFFTHRTSPRYIKAVWSRDSRRCVLINAPDNANSYLWLFRVRGRDIATEKLDYEKISDCIEAAVPVARRREPALTRSGIEQIEWVSSAVIRLHIIYNNIPVVVAIDLTKSKSPSIRVMSHNET